MQLISLWVEDFKNLKDFTIDFENQENLSIIIGNNGSGKSNILEVISAIFAELYGRTYIDNYKLQYKINDHLIEIEKTTKRVPLPFGNQSAENMWRVPVTEFKVDGIKRSKRYLTNNNLVPSKIVSLYSGEETRLYTRYYEAFTNKYLKDLSKSLSPSNCMIYMDKSYWNIALLALILSAKSGNEDHKNFIENELHIKTIHKIKIYFKTSYFPRIIKNSPLDILLSVINSDHLWFKEYEPDVLLELLQSTYGSTFDVGGIFNILLHATLLQKAKAFENIEFTINDDKISLNDLSEGEKKKLLIIAAMDLVANENSLVLLDEPDAHIHIEGKQDIFNLFKKYASFNRNIVITTHSPTLTNCADDKHIIMLSRNSDEVCEIIDDNKKSLIQQLTGNIYSINEQNIIFNSSKPLVLVEGKTDIEYIKRALELYKEFPANYDFMSFNGTGNAPYFYNEIETYVQNRKIIIILDRDKAGITSLGSFIKQKMNDNKWQEYMNNDKVYHINNLYVFLLPKTEEYKDKTNLPFLIEDYFSEECRLRILREKIAEEGSTLKSFGSLEKKVKTCLEKRLKTKNEECMDGFKILLSKIQEIIDGTSIQNLVEVP